MHAHTPSVLIINSPLFREATCALDEDYLPSIGLGILAQAARSRKIHVEFIDAIYQKQGVAEIVRAIEDGHCDAVGLNIFTVNQHLVREIVEKVNRKVTFILGGLSTRELLPAIRAWNTQNQVHVVFGDGEKVFPELVLSKATVHRNIEFHEIDKHSSYYVSDISGVFPARDVFANEPYRNMHGLMEACIVTSRGCIYNCAFCAAASSLNQSFTIREASVESVKADIGAIVISHPEVQCIRVLDDLYLKNKLSIGRATRTFGEFRLKWRAMAHVASIKQVSDDDLRKLQHSGCIELFVGIESGSPRVLRRIHKTSDTNLIREQMRRLFSAGINVKGYFIFGFPDETSDDMDATLRLALELQEDAIPTSAKFRTSVFQFRPYHGTELFHFIEKNGIGLGEKDARFDAELSESIGRPQYNFESGNYSLVPVDLLRNYIAQTARLSAQR